MKWSRLLLLFLNTIFLSESLNVLPSARNLTCYGYTDVEYVCTWIPGNETIEYVARWKLQEGDFWYDCKDARPNACYFHGELTENRIVAVQPKNGIGKSNSLETELDVNYIIPLPPRDLTVVPGEKAEQLYVGWNDSSGWILRNQMNFRLRYRQIDSKKWSITSDIEDYVYVIDGLDAFTPYVIQVQARQFQMDNIYGNWSSPVYMTTREGAPSGLVSVLPVHEYKSENKDYNTYRDILISWMELPKHQHRGILLGYNIKLVCEIESADGPRHFQVPANETTILIQGLKKRLNYTAYITAYNSVGATQPSSIFVPVSDDNTRPETWYTYIVILLCVIMALLLSYVCWVKIKKFKNIMEPFPEPHFFKWKHIPNARAYVEDEVFDEIRQRRAVPTKDELDKLTRKLPDPALKDVIRELLISKYSIDHEWQRIQQRRNRLLSNNTEISFLSNDDDDDGEDLISNLGSMPGCKNTVLSNFTHFQRECSGGLARHHSLPILDEKYTKDDVNMKEEAYTSSSGDTSDIGSESSDQELESECQMMLCHSLPNVHFISQIPGAVLGKPNTISPYTESVGIPKLSQKSRVNVTSLHDNHGYISARDVAKVVQSLTSDPINRSQRTTQSKVSEYLDITCASCRIISQSRSNFGICRINQKLLTMAM